MHSQSRPVPPADLSVPGLIYRRRRHSWVMSWSPRSDLMARGYKGKTVKLWPRDSSRQNEPTRAEWEVISAWCVRYSAEQLLWAHGGMLDDPQSVYDGTIDSLIEIYQTQKQSPFRRLRYRTQQNYTGYLNAIKAAIGKVRVAHITFTDIADWQDRFAGEGKPMKARATALIGTLKRIITFGALVLPKSAGCFDVYDIFAKMDKAHLMHSGSRKRKEYMTAAQCRLLRLTAHAMGHHSIALEQAFAFELGVRQKDVIGEWIPRAWPGVTDVVWGPRKWLMGMRWEEIKDSLIMEHRLSKSVRGNENLNDSDAGKTSVWDLNACPMVMDELRLLTGKEWVSRSDLPASGPLVICEAVDRPWTTSAFRETWRKVATAAGIPQTIQNRDSRPGAATEADVAGAPREKTQRLLGHAQGSTTGIYLREQLEIQRDVQRLRTEKRK